MNTKYAMTAAKLRAVPCLDIDRPIDRNGTVIDPWIVCLARADTFVMQSLKDLAAWNHEPAPR